MVIDDHKSLLAKIAEHHQENSSADSRIVEVWYFSTVYFLLLLLLVHSVGPYIIDLLSITKSIKLWTVWMKETINKIDRTQPSQWTPLHSIKLFNTPRKVCAISWQASSFVRLDSHMTPFSSDRTFIKKKDIPFVPSMLASKWPFTNKIPPITWFYIYMEMDQVECRVAFFSDIFLKELGWPALISMAVVIGTNPSTSHWVKIKA